MNYEERQQAKLERYEELAQRRKRESQERYKHSKSLSDCIPFGQPILVGHHSEKRHRRDIKRIQNSMDKSVELQKKAEHYEKKAENIRNPTAISSDNPEAIDLLKEKLIGLEEQREKIKEHNKKARKENKEQYPAYVLPNLSGNIKSVKDRIERLKNLAKIEEIEEEINGVVLKVDKEENRVRLFFPSKPSEEVRTKLKQNGFRWSPYNSCWQRQISEYAIYLAKEIIKGVRA